MNRRVKLLSIPLHADPAAGLLDVVRESSEQLGSAIWITPNTQAASAAQRTIASWGSPLFAPSVYTFRSFANSVLAASGALRDRRPNTRLLIDEVSSELRRNGRMAYFGRVIGTRGFLEGIEGLSTELESADIAPEQMSRTIGGRGTKLAACAEVYSALRSRAEYLGNPLSRITARLQNGIPLPFNEVQQFVLAGFVQFSPLEWRIVELLAAHSTIWIVLPVVDERNDAFAIVRQTRERLEKLDIEEMSPSDAHDDRPTGLIHLRRSLFALSFTQSSDSDGLRLIEAPGEVGEARMVARRIRSLLLKGAMPDRIVVTTRDLGSSADLIDQVFREYGLPTEVNRDQPLIRNPAIATILRSLRLPDDDWPFADVTSLLRSTLLRPSWPEANAAVIRHSECLLRLLGESRGRESYLRSLRLWAETPPEGLEDEQAEESRRLRKARLANECRPFLERFFQAWDGSANTATFVEFVEWARQLVDELGLVDETDQSAVDALWSAAEREPNKPIARRAFLAGLATIASTERLPRPRPSAGCVRVVSAEEAVHLSCDYLFVLGLGEGSFPRLGPPASLLDDADRGLLRSSGLAVANPDDRLAWEKLLFFRLVARPRRELVLSYAAVDEKGQPLLPCTFLREVRACFTPEAIEPERQRMLIEGYSSRNPLSLREARVQFAAQMRDSDPSPTWKHSALSRETCQHMRWTHEAAKARFHTREFNRFDGWLENASALAAVESRFGPERVFSPTALETYVACPYRFLLQHVMRLDELDEPDEEVEQTRRGSAYHRALSRLHRRLKENAELTKSPLPEQIGDQLADEIDVAVQEYADRAGSRAAKRLWELEGKRLHRSAAKYRGHWEDFAAPWRKNGASLSPELLEADFGLASKHVQSIVTDDSSNPLVIQVDDIEVRIGGRIDRVDVVKLSEGLGFWIIDYKTGRGSNYTATELARFEKLQLPVYALAVEKVIMSNRPSRPLGLAYWLVTDNGPKTVSPGPRSAQAWLADPKKWTKFREQLEAWIAKIVEQIRLGRFPLAPRSDHCTDTCPYGQICRISQSRNVGKTGHLELPQAKEETKSDKVRAG